MNTSFEHHMPARGRSLLRLAYLLCGHFHRAEDTGTRSGSRFVTMSRSKLSRPLLFGLAVGMVLASSPLNGFDGQAAQGNEASTVQSGPSLPAGKRYTVTLLTGDVVTVVTRQSGCPLVSVKPAKPSGIQLRSCDARGH